eukprot:8305544-Pyramimonas_sp.AAC.2
MLKIFRIRWHGNPRFYAVWQDESLNMTLRTAAEKASRIKFEFRIFKIFGLLANLGISRYIHAPNIA